MTFRKITLKRTVDSRTDIDIDLAIHPHINGVIVVNIPGITGDIDGYSNKYRKQADIVQENGIGTVIRMGNPLFKELPYPKGMIDNFRYVLDYCLNNGEELSGKENPLLYLMGFSAGASTIAAVSGNNSAVEKILLVAPTGDADLETVERGLSKFTGEVYIVIGDQDEIVGPRGGQVFYDLATSAKTRKLEVIANCNHQFVGETNGKIMSKAPLWAFAEDSTFPSHDGGRKLYD